MINAHPTLLLHLCKQNTILSNNLNDYVQNRDTKLHQLMNDDNLTRTEAKKLFLISMNSNKLIDRNGKKKITNKFFLDFDREMNTKVIGASLSKTTQKNDPNKEARLLNKLLVNLRTKCCKRL